MRRRSGRRQLRLRAAIVDGTVRVDGPELPIRERERDGRPRLLAVDHIIPYTELSRDATPAVPFGPEFPRNDELRPRGPHAGM